MIYIVLLVVIVFWLYKAKKNTEKKQNMANDYRSKAVNLIMDEPHVKAIVDEAIMVINDMLNVGLGASYCSVLEYDGLILVAPESTNHGQYRINIVMDNVSELQGCANRYPKARENQANYEMFRIYDSFASRYRQYYDFGRRAYIYKTSNIINPVGGGEALKAFLLQQVRAKCPLANVVGSYIKDKRFDY